MRRFCFCGSITKQVPCDNCKVKRRGPKEKKSKLYDSKWKRLSERFRAENPLCKDCEVEGLVTPCQDVHHVVPIRQDPTRRLDVTNLVALCRKCHNERHKTGNL